MKKAINLMFGNAIGLITKQNIATAIICISFVACMFYIAMVLGKYAIVVPFNLLGESGGEISQNMFGFLVALFFMAAIGVVYSAYMATEFLLRAVEFVFDFARGIGNAIADIKEFYAENKQKNLENQ